MAIETSTCPECNQTVLVLQEQSRREEYDSNDRHGGTSGKLYDFKFLSPHNVLVGTQSYKCPGSLHVVDKTPVMG